MYDYKGDGILFMNGRVIFAIGVGLVGETFSQGGVCLVIRGIVGIKEAIYELGQCYHPPFMRKRLILELVRIKFGISGVTDLAEIDLDNVEE